MNEIFHDPELQERFLRDGFVVIDLLDETQVSELERYYYENDMLPEASGFYATMFHPDSGKKKMINTQLCHTIGRAMQHFTMDYVPLFGNFIVKAARNVHEVGIHQDWTYVDERKFRSFNVWTSLCHSNSENGGIFMLPGSHRVRMPIRWTPFDCEIYNNYRNEIMETSIGFSLKPGQAVVYDSGVIHYSTLNNTDEVRLACGCVFTPKEATPVHYWREGDELLVYHVDSQFFNVVVPGEKPPGIPDAVDVAVDEFDQPAFEQLVNAN